MGGISLGRSNFAQSALVSSATLVALMLLASVLAYWTWVWVAPRPAPLARTLDVPARDEAAYGLFGGAQRNRNTTAPTGLAIRLLGIAAASEGKTSYAVVQIEGGKILAAREGMDIAPGIRLAQVQAGQIVLERNGVRETVALPEKNSGPGQTRSVPQKNAPAEPTGRRERD